VLHFELEFGVGTERTANPGCGRVAFQVRWST
jgi:hypothetical protein